MSISYETNQGDVYTEPPWCTTKQEEEDEENISAETKKEGKVKGREGKVKGR